MRGFIKQAKSRFNSFRSRVGLSQADNETKLSALPALLIDAQRIASALHTGTHNLKRAGQGYDFWQFRPYQFGDDPRRIDWRQSARGQDILLREKEQSNMQTALIGVDNTASMHYGRKANHTLISAAAILNALALGGERFGLLDQDGAVLGIGHSKAHSERAIGFLRDTMTKNNQIKFQPREQIPHHACAVFISDYLSPLKESETLLRNLSQRCSRVIALQILDHDEVKFPFHGRTLFTDMAQDDKRDYDAAETIADAYKSKLRTHLNGFHALCKKHSITHLFHETGKAPEQAAKDLWQALHAQGYKQKTHSLRKAAG